MTNPEKPGSERDRDEQRGSETPKFHGGGWEKADEEAKRDPAAHRSEAEADFNDDKDADDDDAADEADDDTADGEPA